MQAQKGVSVNRLKIHVKAGISWIMDILRNRKMILELAFNDLKTRYASSYMGAIWAFIQPVVTVLIYSLVFGVGLRMMPNAGYPYVPWLVAGMIPWFFFQDTVLMSTQCLREYSYLVKKVVFNVKLIPITKEVTALMIHAVFIVLCFVIHGIYGIAPSLYSLQMVYYLFCDIVLSLGIGYLLSALCVFYPDLQQMVSIFLQFGIWLTPIMWQDTLFGETALKIMKFNPLYYIVSGYRDCMFSKVAFWEKPLLTTWFWVFTVVVFVVGINTFRKLEGHFADVL